MVIEAGVVCERQLIGAVACLLVRDFAVVVALALYVNPKTQQFRENLLPPQTRRETERPPTKVGHDVEGAAGTLSSAFSAAHLAVGLAAPSAPVRANRHARASMLAGSMS